MQLTVSWFNDLQGIGAALTPSGELVLLHYQNFTALEYWWTPKPGESVEASVKSGADGLIATEINPGRNHTHD